MFREKQGWVRIVEAVIAILIVAGGLVFFYVQSSDRVSKAEQIYNIERAILEEISRNSEMRNKIVDYDLNNPNSEENSVIIEDIRSFIEARLNAYPNFDFNFKICSANSVCPLEPWPQEVDEIYAEDTLITSTLSSYSPRKLKIFVWGE